ncbi:MAG: WYL domain-containing transcriptional regulator [Clostridia bacterium]
MKILQRSNHMAGNPNPKLKLLYLMKILIEQTDEENTLSLNALIEELKKYDISAERKSIYKDMELLKEFGLDIILKKTKSFNYYIGTRDFELPELKLLVDAVQSSKFITKKKSSTLIKKLENLTSWNLAKLLQRQVFVSDRVKAINEKIYYSIDKLHNAIAQNKQVSFKYFEYTVEKKKQYRRNGEAYLVSPYALSWVDDNYYLVAYYAKHEKTLTHFRVDRMTELKLLEEPRISIKEVNGDKEFNIAKYSKQLFSMFNGECVKVHLQFHKELINVVIDRFGEEVQICKSEGDHFSVCVEVASSSAFLGWLFQFGDKVKILAPVDLVAEMQKMLEKVSANHQL